MYFCLLGFVDFLSFCFSLCLSVFRLWFSFKVLYYFYLFVFLLYKKYKFSLFRQTGFESRTRSRRCNDGGLPVQLTLKTASHRWAYSYKVRYWLLYVTWKIWVAFIILVKWFYWECGFQCKIFFLLRLPFSRGPDLNFRSALAVWERAGSPEEDEHPWRSTSPANHPGQNKCDPSRRSGS